MTTSLLVEKAADRLLDMGAIDLNAITVVESVIEALGYVGGSVCTKVKASDLIDGDKCLIRARRLWTSQYDGMVHFIPSQQMQFVIGSAFDTTDHPDSFVFIELCGESG